ncbi:MAG: hypothetical protein M3R15_20740 [Acidobacteriota bacterium]|nr:hypothetical protein [Acidobacteriota bacterium]
MITHDGVCTNGMWLGWGARELAWRLRIVRRETISIRLGKTLEVLEFKCVGKVFLRGRHIPVDKEWRVPVPAGKEADADALITRLLTAQHAPTHGQSNKLAQPHSLDAGAQNSLFGHDFAGDVCGKCGSTVEAVTHFYWKCKECDEIGCLYPCALTGGAVRQTLAADSQ